MGPGRPLGRQGGRASGDRGSDRAGEGTKLVIAAKAGVTHWGQNPKEAPLPSSVRSRFMRLLPAAAFALMLAAVPAIAQVGTARPEPLPMEDAMPPARDVAYPGTLRLDIDASDTSRGIYRVVETIP